MFPIRDSYETHRPPLINWLIIALNVIAFLYELSFDSYDLKRFLLLHGFVPQQFVDYFGVQQLTTLISSMFLHGGWSHLIGNMWVLLVFGDNVEERMGHARYLVFYLLTGIIACLVGLLFSSDPAQPQVGAM